jgi:multicomponent Na+:H+ antiporter subunit G
MTDNITAFLMILGTFFILTASLGILRMPDVFLRLSVVTKAATLGVGLMLFSLAIYFEDFVITIRAVAIMVFVILTGPVAAHMIGRAAYFINDPLWKETRIDELKGRYNKITEKLASSDKQAKENDWEAEHPDKETNAKDA